MSATRLMRRIIVTVPPDLLQQVEEMATRFSLNRSQFIRQALETFLEEQHRCELRELLKEGYLANAERDRCVAEEFAHADYETVAQPVSREE